MVRNISHKINKYMYFDENHRLKVSYLVRMS